MLKKVKQHTQIIYLVSGRAAVSAFSLYFSFVDLAHRFLSSAPCHSQSQYWAIRMGKMIHQSSWRWTLVENSEGQINTKNGLQWEIRACPKHNAAILGGAISSGIWESHHSQHKKNGSCGLSGDLHVGKVGPRRTKWTRLMTWNRMAFCLNFRAFLQLDLFVQRVEFGRVDWEPDGRLPSRRELDHGRCDVACHPREFGFF